MSYTMQLGKRSRAASVLALLVTLFLLGSQVAQAASWQVVASPNKGTSDNQLTGVAAVNATSIWVVGLYQNSNGPRQTLIEHWNGTSWKVVSSPNVGTGNNQLYGVAVANATNIWAVGSYVNGSGISHTLIERWNGTKWKVVSSPNIGASSNILSGVAAVSATDVWTVGFYVNAGGAWNTMIEHWNGTAWKVVSSPNIGTGTNGLSGVAAVSAIDVWAVGQYDNNGISQTLTEQWNGTKWKIVSSPNGSGSNGLSFVAVVNATNIWAVGSHGAISASPTQPLIEQWNGTKWKIVSSPSLGTYSALTAVTAVSANNVWAVGGSNLNGPGQTLIEHWNGTAWKVVSSPNVGTVNNLLNGVVAVSATNLWAVGTYVNISSGQTLTEEFS